MRVAKREEKRERLKERNEKIRATYQKQWARGFRNEKIVADLQKEYFLDAYTIEAIVYRKNVYKDF
jgi:hypothetical protein